jgi:hypothetical protein
MTRAPLTIMLVAAAALAGCDSEDHTITAGPDAGDTNAAANANVQLPPAIAASKIYRCSGDNSVVQVDWLSDNKSANVRTEQNGLPTQVTTAEAGKPMTAANGLSLTGTASAATISVKLPDGATKTCKG